VGTSRYLRFYARVEDERLVFSYEPEGDPIKPHTYVGFALSLLDHWMNSPGHRKNILDKNPAHLGCAARLARRGHDARHLLRTGILCADDPALAAA